MKGKRKRRGREGKYGKVLVNSEAFVIVVCAFVDVTAVALSVLEMT